MTFNLYHYLTLILSYYFMFYDVYVKGINNILLLMVIIVGMRVMEMKNKKKYYEQLEKRKSEK